MTREALRAGGITQDAVCDALLKAKGDIFVTAAILGVTGRELDGYIRTSEALQMTVMGITQVKGDPAYDKMSSEQFRDEYDRLSSQYKIEAVNEIHALAMMPINAESAAQNDVKLKAAVQLRGPVMERSQAVDNSGVIDELNALYIANAPRIKTMRAVQIEYAS